MYSLLVSKKWWAKEDRGKGLTSSPFSAKSLPQSSKCRVFKTAFGVLCGYTHFFYVCPPLCLGDARGQLKKSSYTTEPFGGFALTGILGMYLRGLQKYGERERTPAPCSSCWPIQSQLGMNKAGGSCHEISGHTHLPLILCPNLTGLKKQTRCP